MKELSKNIMAFHLKGIEKTTTIDQIHKALIMWLQKRDHPT